MNVDLGAYLPSYQIPRGNEIVGIIRDRGRMSPTWHTDIEILDKLVATGLLASVNDVYTAAAGVTL